MRGYVGPGLYRHYRGGQYKVIGLAVREESKESGWIVEVVYQPLTPGSLLDGRPETFWTRVLDDFNAMVGDEPRFQLIDTQSEIA
jgi:hypothetical protein